MTKKPNLYATLVLYRKTSMATGKAMEQLKFEIATQERARAHGSIPVQFRLVNTGTEPMLVNGRLAVTVAGGPGEVQLSASSESGTLPFVADVNVGRPKPAHFRQLPPGDSVTRKDDLRRYLLLREPGTYHITAVYRNKMSGADGLDAVAWTGELAAEPLIVTVEPAAPSH